MIYTLLVQKWNGHLSKQEESRRKSWPREQQSRENDSSPFAQNFPVLELKVPHFGKSLLPRQTETISHLTSECVNNLYGS